ncbi:MAG: hypothetical protein GYA36_02050 [Veillonellaceae bacterium]|nr:hypothetical protein [Veillonellaceae bacterium]
MQSNYTTNRGLPWEPETLKQWVEEHAGPFKWKGYEGQARCRLPSHDGQDQNPSFSFNAKKGTGHCFACHAAGEGISVKEMAAALGVEPPPMKQIDPAPPARRIVATYDYMDATGNLLHQSCRFKPKGFSQRRPDGKGGWIWNLQSVKSVPYRLPELLQALAQGEPVFIVEGEKDADRLHELNLPATTNSGGAGKWTNEHSKHFPAGAMVIILPDNDEPGRKHAQAVARSLHGRGCVVKVMKLPDLPPKGDVSDWLAAGHTKEDLLEQIKSATEWAPEAAPSSSSVVPENDEFTEWRKLYGKGYTVDENGGICYEKVTNDGTVWVQMANFAPRIVSEVTKDDGEGRALFFEIDAVSKGGRMLPPLLVSVLKYITMNWVVEGWGSQAVITFGSTIKDRLRYVLQLTGSHAEHKTIFTHTGWRKTSEGWIFLHGGGAIGAAGVAVELPAGLSRYSLPESPDRERAIEAAKTALLLLECGPGAVTFPVWALAFLAPLVEPLKQAGYSPNFVLWLVGPTMAGKSTFSGLVTSFFGGSGSGDNAPASFRDTGNSSDVKAFTLKDLLLWVDDFHPCGSPKERQRMVTTAEIILGGYGDRMGRGRLTSDVQLRQDKIPRGLCLVTGEDLPELSQSRLARLFAVELKSGDMDFAKITRAQEQTDLLPVCMAAYIDWLRPQIDQLAEEFRKAYPAIRSSFSDVGAYGRIPSNAAWLMIGAEAALQYMTEIGAMSIDQAEEYRAGFRQTLQVLAVEQGRRVAEDSPSVKFTSALRELVATGRCIVREIDDGRTFSAEPGTDLIGWQDEAWLYLLPDTIYKAVVQFFNGQGLCFPVAAKTLWKHLDAAGVIRAGEDSRTELKRIQGKRYRVLTIRRSIIIDE